MADTPDAEHDLPRWYPFCCGKPFLYGYTEALGWLLSNCAHAVYLIGAGAFVVPAIMHLASKEAGCETELAEGETILPECTETVYGMKPSSLITLVSTISSVVVAITTPLLGALVDYTPHRRLIGRILSLLYCLLVVPQIFLSEDNWFGMLMGFLLLGTVMWSQTLTLHAYLPELTDNEEELNQLTKVLSLGPFLSIIVFTCIIMAISTIFGWRDNEVATARLSAAVCFPMLCVVYSISWGILLEKRPALNKLQPGQSLWTAGFTQVYKTSKMIYHNYKALAWFYVAVAFGDVKPIATIAITFFTDQLQFTPTENGITAVVLLVSGIPGALLASWCTRRLNAIWTSILSMIIMIIFSTLSAAILKEPGQQMQAFLITAGWGVGSGVKLTSTRMLASAIIPQGQEAELMGFYLFADMSLSWLAPLVYTSLNEAGISQRVGLASLNVYFIIALFAHAMMGSYSDAIKAGGRLVESEEEKQQQSSNDITLDAIESMSAGGSQEGQS